jgi:sodium transport system permease protein
MLARPTTSRLVLVVLTKELRETLRDINTLLFSVLFPLLFFPACVWLFTQVQAYVVGQQEPPRVTIVGDVPVPEDAERVETDADATAARTGDVVQIRYRSTDMDSLRAEARLEAAVRDLWPVETKDLAPGEEPLAQALARVIPLLLVIGSLFAGLYPAVEAVVAERERGTVETTLVTAAPRWVFFVGKLGSVLLITVVSLCANAVAIAVTVLHLLSLLDAKVDLPIGRLLAVIPLAACAAIFLAALSLFAAVPTRSFKQAQNTTTAMATIASMLAVTGIVPNVTVDLRWALLPVTNAVVLMAQQIQGRAIGGWGWIAGTELLVLAGLILYGASRIAVREDLR